jgi:hypothetical protein
LQAPKRRAAKSDRKDPAMRGNDHDPTRSESAALHIHGAPGERARHAGVARAIRPLLVAMFVAGVLVGNVLPWHGAGVPGVVLLVAAVATLYATLVLGRRRVASFFLGAAGEQAVGAELARLPGGRDLFHGVDLGAADPAMRKGSDLDHVVVGPEGVCVVETKAWSGRVTLEDGRFLVDGRAPTRPPLMQIRTSTRMLSDWLARHGEPDVPVRAIVCFAGTGGRDLHCRVDEVAVCGLPYLRETILRPQGEVSLSAGRQSRIAALLDGCVKL